MTKTIILFDMDGVLIRAQGYRESIRAAFEHLAAEMDQKHLPAPTHADMLAFEAQSIIFEWDSLPIMLAAILQQVPQFWKDSLKNTLSQIAAAGIKLKTVDYIALAQACPPAQAEIRPAYAAWQALFPKEPLFAELLGQSHSIHAPLTRLIQNVVLGSDQFFRTYGLPPQVESASFLTLYDKPALSVSHRESLLADSDIYPVIYTARPSLPPHFVLETRGYSPEAELGAQLLGLEGQALAGYGKMQWFAQQQGHDPSDWVKPSPMHALFGIFCALLPEEEAFALALDPQNLPAKITNEDWRVVVMEDSPNSIKGVQNAVAQIPHQVAFVGVGIGSAPDHLAKLSAVAHFTAPDVNSALDRLA